MSELAFNHTSGSSPGVLFLPGFHSTMQGNKAQYLERYCESCGIQFTRFDYFGHGESAGEFEHGTIDLWRDNALEILDSVCVGPQVLVGSSMGGWIATLAALERPQRVHALLGIASAPDLTDQLLSPALTPEQHNSLRAGHTVHLNNHYDDACPHKIRQPLLNSGHACNVLDRDLPIHCPIRLLHGTGDTDVPWSLSEQLLSRVASEDAQLLLLKGSDHRFSLPSELAVIQRTLAELLAL